MIFGTPSRINLRQDTEQLLEQVDTEIKEFNKLRPLSSDVKDRLKMAFLPDRVTSSLNMEGIVATRRQTLAIMDSMTLQESASKSEQEVLNALGADELTIDAAEGSEKLSENLIRQIHAKIEDCVGESPGCYRQRDVKISQALFTPPTHMDVPALMSEMVGIYLEDDTAHPIVRSAWLHNRFTHIHPFLDGNGRTARLLQDYTLLMGKLFPTGVPSALRDDYYDALSDADNDEWDGLVSIIANRQLSIISKATGIANERQERSVWVARLAQKADDKKRGAQHKQFLVWSHKMNEIQSTFEAVAQEISSTSDVLSVEHQSYPMMDFKSWKEMNAKGRRRDTWLFSQTLRVDGEQVFRFVFYFRPHITFPADPFQTEEQIICLRFTGGKTGERYDFGLFQDPDIRLRELLFHAEDLYHYYFKGKTRMGRQDKIEEWEVDCNLSINQILEDLYSDLFERKIGV
ncbi:Fic family protein [Shimia thalassica]|uniref:Fic family protein n=1 Tax=Shimia thalassica TaxID=1715693 RepID=UPI0027369661|nr:Fic family protein [Shimia thalassica]MDP2492739.1 Fic family protein [Shimia thalassica]